MTDAALQTHELVVVEATHLQKLLDLLREKGYSLIGPTVRDGAIVCEEISSATELPAGWTDEQKPGAYHLSKRADRAYFGYAVGPHSWKRYLHPPAIRLFRAQKGCETFHLLEEEEEFPRYAFIGVRPCELEAIAIQDRVFLQNAYVEPHYAARRANLFLLAVNCTQPGGTCFCASMGAGPTLTGGYDLGLTEILEGKRHYFLMQAGTARGAEILAELPHQLASDAQRAKAAQLSAKTSAQMGRTLDTSELKDILYRNYESPHWDEVAARCLSCGNCTLVCPTCFCTTVEDTTDLTGEKAERWRRWDSCHTLEFSYIYGGSLRYTPAARYRQWVTHKLAAWIDQFGRSGCVGCGRCITWCPAGIDLTEEIRVLREGARNAAPPDSPISTAP